MTKKHKIRLLLTFKFHRIFYEHNYSNNHKTLKNIKFKLTYCCEKSKQIVLVTFTAGFCSFLLLPPSMPHPQRTESNTVQTSAAGGSPGPSSNATAIWFGFLGTNRHRHLSSVVESKLAGRTSAVGIIFVAWSTRVQ